ncbi:hypothetical protein [Hyphomicrobium sp.]|uniref:hypothetical protein n=1 Tax=Hyphomicrobium sp. TaxID=82 RepID=UPI000F9BF16D|nr:hypothetical protein [Hyphomicrobium sp.]RUP11203.1 MAG: hypothetical protein EKK38_01765 [Hyphomicrobium sp.]
MVVPPDCGSAVEFSGTVVWPGIGGEAAPVPLVLDVPVPDDPVLEPLLGIAGFALAGPVGFVTDPLPVILGVGVNGVVDPGL